MPRLCRAVEIEQASRHMLEDPLLRAWREFCDDVMTWERYRELRRKHDHDRGIW